MALYLVPLQTGRPIVLDKAVVFIGRHPECDVVIKHSRKISRKHCCIAQVDKRLVVRDLGSMNGIRLNGRRISKEAPVEVGDELLIGDVGYLLQASAPQAGPTSARARPANGSARVPPAESRQPPQVPVNLSQDYPVPIPEEEDGDQPDEPLLRETPDVLPPLEEGESGLAPDRL